MNVSSLRPLGSSSAGARPRLLPLGRPRAVRPCVSPQRMTDAGFTSTQAEVITDVVHAAVGPLMHEFELGKLRQEAMFDKLLARLDAMDKRLDAMGKRQEKFEGSMAQRFDSMEGSVAQRFDKMEGSVAQRFDKMEGSVAQRFDKVDQRLDTVDKRLDTVSGTAAAHVAAHYCVCAGGRPFGTVGVGARCAPVRAAQVRPPDAACFCAFW